MRKLANKVAVGLSLTGAATLALLTPALAFAAPLSTSTAQTIVINATGDLSAVLAGIIPVVLVILVSLLALGMGIRYVRKHVSGRKF